MRLEVIKTISIVKHYTDTKRVTVARSLYPAHYVATTASELAETPDTPTLQENEDFFNIIFLYVK